VPGPTGRLAAAAAGLGDRVYLFGGYTVDAEGGEVSVADLDIYDAASDTYSKGKPFPLPVDDAVLGVWRDSLIFIVSGWSQRDNVAEVQIYDPAADAWQAATPIPGPPVFGHAGAIVDDAIVYCDGVRVDPERSPRFVMAEACYRGDIDPANPSRIGWRELVRHPGPARYRMAAGALPEAGLVVFAGGTDNPYNFNGIGYDGVASDASVSAYAYDVQRDGWIELTDLSVPTMDHRALVGAGDTLYLIGGMNDAQRVTNRVQRLHLVP
jgi:N-acetylneuraminic acid mutarotase